MKDYSALIDASMILGVFFFAVVSYAIAVVHQASKRLAFIRRQVDGCQK